MKHKITPYFLLLGIIALHLFLLYNTVFWVASEFQIFPYLTSHGLLPYKQIIDQHFPGLFFLPVNVYSLGLANPFGLRLLQFGTVIITQIMMYFLLRKWSNSSYKPLIANGLYILLQIIFEGYVLWIESLLAPFVLLSYVLIAERGSASYWRFLFSGLSLALAFYFKQTIALVFCCVLLVLLMRKVGWKNIIMFTIGFSIPALLLFIYFYHLGVWKDFWYWTYTFNKTIYAKYAFRSPTLKETVFMGLLIVPTYIVGFYGFLKKKLDVLLIVYMVPLLTLIYGRYDFVHLQPFIPFAVMLLASSSLIKQNKTFPLLLGYFVILTIIYLLHIPKLGHSTTLFDTSANKKLISTIRQLHKDGKTIYLSSSTELYSLTDTLPANGLYIPSEEWYILVAEGRLTASLEESKPDVIFQKKLQDSKSRRYTDFIQQSYRQKEVIDGYQILEYKKVKITSLQ